VTTRTTREQTVDVGAIYERTRRALSAAIAGCTPDELDRRVPATPEWSVRDVLAHVTGLAADLNAQRFPDPRDEGGTAWAEHQVQSRRDQAVAAVIDEWEREGPAFADVLRAFGYEFGCHFIADLHAHHQDVRQALGLSVDDDRDTVLVALDHYVAFIDELLVGADWGRLEIVTPDEQRAIGSSGPHHARVGGSSFEMLRSLSARRSANQVRALDWSGDRDDFVEFLSHGLAGGYRLPHNDLIEPSAPDSVR
jgi:hypothetical protein